MADRSKVLGLGYAADPIRAFAESFHNTVQSCVQEGSVDYFRECCTAVNDPAVKDTLRKFFVKESYDPEDPIYKNHPAVVEEHVNDMEQLFENDVKGMIEESAPVNSFNALVGMALPMHKNIMMNMVWDKGGIPKKTAPAPRFTRTMETRLLVTPDGKEIDMWLEQSKMTDAMMGVNPWKTQRFVKADPKSGEKLLSESAQFDYITLLEGKKNVDHIDIETYVSAVLVKDVVFEAGDALPGEDGFIPDVNPKKATGTEKHDLWIKVRAKFNPGMGEIKRQLMKRVAITVKKEEASAVKVVNIDDVIVGNITGDNIMLSTMSGVIDGIEVSTKLDASMRTIETCSVKWSETTTEVEIGTDAGISTTVSPEEIKDISVLYNINQLTKVMSLMKTALSNRKDDLIMKGMDESYSRLPESQKFHGVFDYAPREGYLLDHIEWRTKTFWDYFDTQITQMLRVLNDPNMTVSVFGEPDIIRKITPKTYTYVAPGNIGPVELDFSKTVVTSDKRVYSFVGSDKMRTEAEPQMIITLNPRNTMRITYVIYDYQFYISNEIRQNNNPALPNILAFERWLFDEYQPVQGRLTIANPSGLRPEDNQTTPFNVFVGY